MKKTSDNVTNDMQQKSTLMGIVPHAPEHPLGEMKIDPNGGKKLSVSITFPKQHRKLTADDKKALRDQFAKLANEQLAKDERELRLQALFGEKKVILSEELILPNPNRDKDFDMLMKKLQAGRHSKPAAPADSYVSPMGEGLPIKAGSGQ